MVNKTQLIDAIDSKTDLPKVAGRNVVNSFLYYVTGALMKGEQVRILGFGTFSVRTRAARTGRNPKTGAEIQIAAACIPTFVAGKALKEAVAAQKTGTRVGSYGHTKVVEFIAKDAGLLKTQATFALNALLDTIVDALGKGDQVALIGFGTFSVSIRAARTGRNPKTGEKIQIAEARVPSFKPGKALKDSCQARL